MLTFRKKHTFLHVLFHINVQLHFLRTFNIFFFHEKLFVYYLLLGLYFRSDTLITFWTSVTSKKFKLTGAEIECENKTTFVIAFVWVTCTLDTKLLLVSLQLHVQFSARNQIRSALILYMLGYILLSQQSGKTGQLVRRHWTEIPKNSCDNQKNCDSISILSFSVTRLYQKQIVLQF